MQYKANSLHVNNVAESYIESHLNFGTHLISRGIFYTCITSVQSMEIIEQILDSYDFILKCDFIKF